MAVKPPRLPFPTKEEFIKLFAWTKHMRLQHLKLDSLKPRGVMRSRKSVENEIRREERRVRRMGTRLDKAAQDFEQQFDQNP